MHILLIHQAFAAIDEPGGTRHHEMSRHLAAAGHKVTIIASPVSYLTGGAEGGRIPWRSKQDGGTGVTILRAYTYPALHKSFAHRLLSFLSFMVSSFIIGLSVRRVDLVWGTSPPIFQGIPALVLARLKGAKFLFEVRDLWPAFAVAVGVLSNPLLIRASEWLERFLYRAADQLLSNSPGFIEHIKDRGGKALAMVPNGADSGMFDPQGKGVEFRQTHDLADKFIALYAGAHGMSNDLDVLLDTAQLLNDKPNIALVLLGSGKEKSRLMQRAAEMSLSNLYFTDPLPKAEMRSALAAANACIAILKPIEMYKTVYPNKVFDYMAAGRPIVLAIDGVIRAVVENANAGIFCQPGNPQAIAETIIQIAQNPEQAGKMGISGRAYLKAHFERTNLAKDLEELLLRTIEK